MKNNDFNQKWLKAFGNRLTAEQIEKAAIGQENGFLWHAFSYGFLDCLTGDDARNAYDKIDKVGAQLAFYAPDTESKTKYSVGTQTPITEDYVTASQIDVSEEVEIYVTGKNYEWCYIRTHEDAFGPYFCRKNQTRNEE